MVAVVAGVETFHGNCVEYGFVDVTKNTTKNKKVKNLKTCMWYIQYEITQECE